jgi:hypothetical protein
MKGIIVVVLSLCVLAYFIVPSEKELVTEMYQTPTPPVYDTVYVDNKHIVDSLKDVIKNQDRYIIVIENDNQLLGSFLATKE